MRGPRLLVLAAAAFSLCLTGEADDGHAETPTAAVQEPQPPAEEDPNGSGHEPEARPAGDASAEDARPSMVVDGDRVDEGHIVLTGAALASDDFPGSWPMFGSDYRMKFGGYFKLDLIQDFDGHENKYQFTLGGIPIDGSPEAGRGGYFNMHVQETRFNFDIRRTTAGEPAQRFFLEMDFFVEDEGPRARLRHAYAVYGNLLVGRSWTTLSELRALPFIIDFAYGDALFGGRTEQVRWQQQINPNLSWAIGLENPPRGGIANPTGLGGRPSPQLPKLAARLTYERPSGGIMLGGETRQLRWDGEGKGPDVTALGWSAVFAARRNFGSVAFLSATGSYSDGLADGLLALTPRSSAAVLTPAGVLETDRVVGGSLGGGVSFSRQVSMNVSFGWFDVVESSEFRPPEDLHGGPIASANLIWHLSKAFRTGIEFLHGKRNNLDGASGSASRLQAMFRYDW